MSVRKPAKTSTVAGAKVTLEVTGEQILFAIGQPEVPGPLALILSERWPLDFEVNYGLGRLVAKLEWERRALEAGRIGLLKKHAKLKSGEIVMLPTGRAEFESVESEGAFRRAWDDAFKQRTRQITNVRPLYASDFPKDVLAALKKDKDKYTAAALGSLSGTPFLIEDTDLF